MMEGVWCVIPVHNNGETIRAVVKGCCAQEIPVLVVDDGSTDVQVASLLADLPVTVLTQPENRGKGVALQRALQFVREQGGVSMITLDADGQHLPEDIPRFLDVLQRQPDAIVIGCRNMQAEHVPESSRFGCAFSNFWIRLETGLSLRDTQSGFRAYPVEALSRIRLVGRRYDFEAEVLSRAAWAGVSILEVDVQVWYPPPEERVSSFRAIADNLVLTGMHSRLVARRLVLWPVQLVRQKRARV